MDARRLGRRVARLGDPLDRPLDRRQAGDYPRVHHPGPGQGGDDGARSGSVGTRAPSQIKSWEFDSEGGHGESLWARLGNQWVVKASGVLQDGRTATATHTITPEDPYTCRWRTTDRTVGADVVPVVDEFVMVRPAPKPRTK